MLVGTVIAALATVSLASLPHQEVLKDVHVPSRVIGSSCDANNPPSCSQGTEPSNLCCYESPGGLIALVQFWDWKPAVGPSDSWTIHGLWADNCDGSFPPGACDPSREYTDITGLLTSQGASDTLSIMQNYWKDNQERTEHFWQHEWANHGTCYSTLEPTCLPDGSPRGAEAVAFFQTVVRLFKQYNLHQALEDAGVTPSTDTSYSSSQISDAIQSAFGVEPQLECRGHYLSEVYIYHNLRGSVIDGTFTAIDAPKNGNCPRSGIKYPPKE
ncbi:hypothetical protein M378DRAFT_24615 [Amanita muscaria Koide BX008]|uniref:Uncharacterized protein n=1 Tax=Amanita muscaria (strain Koide BX008) TaxID=946122 RepID=A0A0C2X6H7_AMAMK|nr:hypothetical protein M378DRAFT_24615 [Amanita muscaria Koide BX008]